MALTRPKALRLPAVSRESVGEKEPGVREWAGEREELGRVGAGGPWTKALRMRHLT